MSSGFYDRKMATTPDGGRMWTTQEDRKNEDEVIALLEKAWKCAVHRFGALSPIDFFALRNESMVAVMELKTRSHEHGRYPTVFLSVRKWLALTLASVGLNVRALFVVKFTNGVYYIDLKDVDATKNRMAGIKEELSPHDHLGREPIIDVPIGSLIKINGVS
jgi:hypothetical protein